MVDFSVMLYAIENNCRLLTGESKLRKTTENENITVSGILYIIDLLMDKIDNELLLDSIELLRQSNERLPKNLIQERIDSLKQL